MKIKKDKVLKDVPQILKIGPKRTVTALLWALLFISFAFAVFKSFTAVDIHTVHEVERVEARIIDTNGIESFVSNFVSIYFAWDNTAGTVESRLQRLEDYMTEELVQLNKSAVTVNTPTKAAVDKIQIWDIRQIDETEYKVLFSVQRKLSRYDYAEEPALVEMLNSRNEWEETVSVVQTQAQTAKWDKSYYTVLVHVDEDGSMVITANPTISGAPAKSDYTPLPLINDGALGSETRKEVEEFLTIFFGLYPQAQAKDLPYYVQNEALQPVNRESLEFTGITSLILAGSEESVLAHVCVSYFDAVSMITEYPQFKLELKKESGNWVIVNSK